jgi:transposase
VPAERIEMRKLREIVRLLAVGGLSKREIAGRVGVAASTVREAAKKVSAAGLTWPLPEELSDVQLEALLYKNAGKKQGHRRIPEPDWTVIHRELKRKHVTLAILWEEYIAAHADGYRYSRFCELYRAFADRLPVTMRQSYAGGEKLFVDYAGDAVPVIVDRLTRATRPAQIFPSMSTATITAFPTALPAKSLRCGSRPAR